jgi:hypothetical protein
VVYDCDEMPEISGVVASRMGAAAEFVLTSTLSAEGRISHMLMQGGRRVGEDSRLWGEAMTSADEQELPACGPLHFVLRFYLRDAGSLRGAGLRLSDMRAFLREYQGVRIYRDGLRVMPYGDPSGGGDWLGLNARRVRSPGGLRNRIGEWRIAENQVVGAVFISRAENRSLYDQTNREGLVANPAFWHMRAFVLNSIEFLERKRQEHFLAGRTAALLLAPTIATSVRLKVDGNLEPSAVLIDAWQEAVPID